MSHYIKGVGGNCVGCGSNPCSSVIDPTSGARVYATCMLKDQTDVSGKNIIIVAIYVDSTGLQDGYVAIETTDFGFTVGPKLTIAPDYARGVLPAASSFTEISVTRTSATTFAEISFATLALFSVNPTTLVITKTSGVLAVPPTGTGINAACYVSDGHLLMNTILGAFGQDIYDADVTSGVSVVYSVPINKGTQNGGKAMAPLGTGIGQVGWYDYTVIAGSWRTYSSGLTNNPGLAFGPTALIATEAGTKLNTPTRTSAFSGYAAGKAVFATFDHIPGTGPDKVWVDGYGTGGPALVMAGTNGRDVGPIRLNSATFGLGFVYHATNPYIFTFTVVGNTPTLGIKTFVNPAYIHWIESSRVVSSLHFFAQPDGLDMELLT